MDKIYVMIFVHLYPGGSQKNLDNLHIGAQKSPPGQGELI